MPYKKKPVSQMTMLDDPFMTAVFQDNPEAVQLVLRIVLNNPGITVTEVRTQRTVKSVYGHSLVLDASARDSAGCVYDVEIQNDSRGASPRRARYHASLLDAASLGEGDTYENLPESYVIFLTKNDVACGGRPIRHFNRRCVETGEPFDDGSNIVYVNCSYSDEDSELGKLIYDLRCAEPAKMKHVELARRAQALKEDEMFVEANMDEIFHDGREEGLREGLEQGLEQGYSEFAEALKDAGVDPGLIDETLEKLRCKK